MIKMSDTTQQSNNTNNSNLTLPSAKTLTGAFRLSVLHGKPVCGYFYIDSLKNKVCIRQDGEGKIIYKDEDEYTSPLEQMFRSENEYIAITHNTIYILSGRTEVKKEKK
jgi:hypothetical protein